jgi:hypothetical protein
MKQLDDVQQTLLVELHGLISRSATRAAAKLGTHQPFVPIPGRGDSSGSPDLLANSIAAMRAALVSYPPSDGRSSPLSQDEHEALVQMQLSPAARTALEKLFADAAAEVIFGLLCMVDGVGDPDVAPVKTWVGADLGARRSHEDREMLHDAFFESYWRYLDLTTNPPR